MRNEQEIWKDIPTYEGFYQASSLGRNKNIGRFVTGKLSSERRISEKIMAFQINKKGYYSVKLSKNGISVRFFVARLIAITFIENIKNNPQVNHINGIKKDNRVENLEWCTILENILLKFMRAYIRPP